MPVVSAGSVESQKAKIGQKLVRGSFSGVGGRGEKLVKNWSGAGRKKKQEGKQVIAFLFFF